MRFAGLFLVVLTLLNGSPVVAENTEPRTRIENFHAQLIGVMKSANELGVKGRFDRIKGKVQNLFDLQLMAALASGRHWRAATAEDRRALVTAFGEFSAANYADRFNGFSGQKFETVSVADGPRGTRIVNTRIVSPDREPVAISYVMRKSGESWLIADILLIGGISEIATKRSEYRSVLKSGGTAALTNMLKEKTRAMLAGG